MEAQRKEDPILTATEVRRLLEFLLEAPISVEGEHLTENDVASYGQGDLGEADIERIDQHLAACETCSIRMEWRLTVVLAEEAVSFEDFMAKMESKLKQLVSKYRIPQEDVEDILQNSVLALLYQWERVGDPEGWLFGTVRRHCLIYWRTKRRRIYSAVDAAVLEWLSQPLDPSQERSQLLSDLEDLIERLPPRCRTLLRLRFRLGYEPVEVAEKLGYRASSIGKITNRCLTALSNELLASGLVDSLGGMRRPFKAKNPNGEPGPGDGG